MLPFVCFSAFSAVVMAAADDKMEIDDSLYRLIIHFLFECLLSRFVQCLFRMKH